MGMTIDIEAKTASDDNVRIERYDIEPIRAVVPDWDRWPRWLRHWFCRYRVEPVHVGRVANVTCDAFHEYHALTSTLGSGDDDQLDPPAEIGFGDDDSAFSTSDTALNNEVGERTPITDPSADGKTFNVDEYLSSNEQNGNTLRELGIFSESGDLWQHSATDQVYNKDSTFALVINISIPFSDV